MSELSDAILALTSELKRYNDIISPPMKKRSEAEYGKASYEDRDKREARESIESSFSTAHSKSPQAFNSRTNPRPRSGDKE